jgi:Domain of unknown function (DUF6777)/TIR domain
MTTDAPGVFISYRRKESSSFAGRLYDRLVQRLGEARVFMDVDSIKPGQDWTEAISHAVAQCGLMLVLIGHQWAQVRTGSSARISDTDDYVRLEIEAAFDQDIPIIPVLLEDATMPGQADLPESLVKLSHLQAMRVRHESFRSDSTTLFTVVQEVLAAHEKEGPGGGHDVVDNILASHEKDEAANRTSRYRQVQPDGAIGRRRLVDERADDPPDRFRPRPGLARRVLVPLLLLISILAVGFAIWTVIPTTTSDQAAGEEIPESVDTVVNPFLVGVEPDAPETRKPKAAGAVKGDVPGLYGGTRRKTSCDAARLVAFLQTHPDKGAAWAGALGMSLDQVPSFVTQLTPVILRADTRVTNHGFVDGHVTTFYSILQAGTAVLVDQHGVPAVKCFCGNPLTQASSDPPHPYRGNPWPGFDAKKVIVIKPATSAIKSLTVVDTSTGKKSSKPTGVKILPAEKSVQEPVSAETTTPQSAGPSPAAPSSAADTAGPTSSPAAGTVDTASPAESDGSTTPGSTIGTESVDPTESVTTGHPTDSSSPDPAESKGAGQETDSGKEGGKSQEDSGSGQTEGNGSGKTQTGTDSKQAGTDNKGDTGTTGGGATNEDAGGGATSGPGTE